jgi:hypothetical protein
MAVHTMDLPFNPGKSAQLPALLKSFIDILASEAEPYRLEFSEKGGAG